MSNETLTFVLPMSGAIMTILLGVIGFFLKTVHSDVKSNTEAVGNVKGEVDVLAKQQAMDIKRIEELTQLELKVMSEKVGELSTNVNSLVQIMIKEAKETKV